MKAHELARKEIKALYPDIKVGLTLSLHDIQPQAGGEARAASAVSYTHLICASSGLKIAIAPSGAYS